MQARKANIKTPLAILLIRDGKQARFVCSEMSPITFIPGTIYFFILLVTNICQILNDLLVSGLHTLFARLRL